MDRVLRWFGKGGVSSIGDGGRFVKSSCLGGSAKEARDPSDQTGHFGNFKREMELLF